jgi:hypothetical protein
MLLCRKSLTLNREKERYCLNLGQGCSLIRALPKESLPKNELLDIFYNGITDESKTYLDSCASCVFRERTPAEAEELMVKNKPES